MPNCPLCGEPCDGGYRSDTETFWYECKACKKFTLPEEAQDLLREQNYVDRRWCLSIASAQAQLATGQRFHIDTTNIDQLIQAYQSISYSTKRHTLLEFMEKHSKFVGAHVRWDFNTCWAELQARSAEEVSGILDGLMSEGLVELHQGVPGQPTGFRLTPKAWIALEPISGGTGVGFIAMSFAPELDDAYAAISRAIQFCGFQAIRVDRQHFPEKICDRVMADIRRSQFVVVDVTSHRPNVYYEAGFAEALGKPIFWTCRTEEGPGPVLSFDVRQYQHLFWEDPTGLEAKLTERFQARLANARR